MLAECFGFLPLRDLILASHVSHAWRVSALEFPTLWSHIDISWSAHSPDDILNLAVSRAGELPVDFEYDARNVLPSQSFRAAVGQHMQRFRSFRWAYDIRALDRTSRAPLLETFISVRNYFPLNKKRLRTLRIARTRFPEECPALATLTLLRASCHGLGRNRGQHRIFSLCPRLETLHLCDIHPNPEGALPMGPVPPTLRVVKLGAGAGCDLVQLYNASCLISVPHVRLKLPLETAHDVSPFLDGALGLSVTFERPKKFRIAADMLDSRIHRLVLYALDQALDPAPLVATILHDMTNRAAVRSLRIPLAVLALLVAAGIHWPAVSQLTVDVFEDVVHDTQAPAAPDWKRVSALPLGAFEHPPVAVEELSGSEYAAVLVSPPGRRRVDRGERGRGASAVSRKSHLICNVQ
ncbi:hypothetical protein AURDEDRAFT_171193 [Auricularia subglabra TFB-10046 SS5]|uniref:F-box domain-containing protein n=1 Tax=Auricularia subglabra (strain TFB-10046 / SS5) TaxID=717982 RepID=J0DCB7_AURST|nr:hypothetical protein AURDEDRAFT_171193 [Auricularia subglabra TFB-10046 SS5]